MASQAPIATTNNMDEISKHAEVDNVNSQNAIRVEGSQTEQNGSSVIESSKAPGTNANTSLKGRLVAGANIAALMLATSITLAASTHIYAEYEIIV
ncbi:hypothetical protein AAE478_002635 [Parahypoxylon ruwenzoriense]